MAEFEELKLSVTLTDNASAGLANLRTQITQLAQATDAVSKGLTQVATQATQVGNAAKDAAPKVSSQEKALKELSRGAEETTRGLVGMALAARRGAEAFPELALATREAFTGLRGVNVAMGELGVASRAMVVGLSAVVVGIGAIGAAVAAYGISVFKFSQEMFTLSQTARALGMTFGQLRSITEQNERFGISAEATVAQIGKMNEAITDLNLSGSKLRQSLLSQGVPAQWIDDMAKLTDETDKYNKAREGMITLYNQQAARGRPDIGATISSQFGAMWGLDAGARIRPARVRETHEEAELNKRIAEQSEKIAEQWRDIKKILGDIRTEFLAWGLPDVLKTVTLIKEGFESIGKVVKSIDDATPQWLKNVFRGMAAGPGHADDNLLRIRPAPNYNPRSGYRPPHEEEGPPASAVPAAPTTPWWNTPNRNPRSGYHPTSFGGANDNFGGAANDNTAEGRLQSIVKSGVYEALIEFYGFLRGGATGGAGGFQNASLTTGGGLPGTGAAGTGAAGSSGGWGNAQFPNLGGGPNGAGQAGLPGGPTGAAPADAGRPASGKRAERIAAAKAAMKDQLVKDGVPEANAEEASNLLAGQALAESGLDPSLSHDQGTGHGIYGARLDRRTAMHKWLAENGYDKNSLEGQSRYMAHEAMTGKAYGRTRAALMGATPENRAANTDAITRNFESPRVINNRTGQVREAAGVAAAAPSTAAGAPGAPGAAATGAEPNQADRPYKIGGKVEIGGQTFDWGSGGMKRGSIPYGSFPVNVGKGDIGPIGQRIGSVATVGAPGGEINDPKYPGAQRAGIQIHPGSGETLDRLYTEGCFSVPPSQWPEFKRTLLAESAKHPEGLNLTIPRRGNATISPNIATTARVPALGQNNVAGSRTQGTTQPTAAMPPVQGFGGEMPDTSSQPRLPDSSSQPRLPYKYAPDLPYKSMDRGALDRPLDRAAMNDNRLQSTGSLSVDVNAPPGTKVDYSGDGLLRATSMQRQTQMMPTDTGPSVGDTARSYMRGGS